MADRYDKLLEKYFTGGLDLEIKIREQELRHPQMEVDENIGGGRAQNKRSYNVENTMARIESDEYLNELKRQKSKLQACVDMFDGEKKAVFYQHYRNRLNWELIGNLNNIGRRTAIRWRDELKILCETYNIFEDEL
ncbi:RinA family phage transcriptional activator [Weissella uvarum]|uniref:DUF722 domain-containing protein n=1 Tax=Lactobacillaceae TaxID=33958 RepID=UPI0019600720|nr:RinA family phage transcriptional activator [Weissella uvarum]MCM0595224.1 DUF722 domain-containing protein [Weissella uvarum]MCM0601460.1 DUF722 domain-containing protein [Periweissella ghanensis]